MKRFFKPQVVLTLVVFLALAAAVTLAVARPVFRSHAAAPVAVTLSATSARAGTSVLATGSGWVPGHPITVVFDRTPMGTFTPSAATWQQPLHISSSAPKGVHMIFFEETAPGTALAAGVSLLIE